MKHLLALLWFCNAQAQNFPLEPSLPEKLAQICAPLNKAQVPTGYLYNLAVPLVEPLAYRGSAPPKALTFTFKTQHRRTQPQPSP